MPEPEEEKIVPEQTRIVNGWFFSRALQENPEVKILGVKSLVSGLQTTMQNAGIHDHDMLLSRCQSGANRAWYELTGERNPGRAVQTANQVLGEVMFLVLDARYAKGDLEKFKLSGGR